MLDTYSRPVVGWSIHSWLTAALATNALGMPIEVLKPAAGAIHPWRTLSPPGRRAWPCESRRRMRVDQRGALDGHQGIELVGARAAGQVSLPLGAANREQQLEVEAPSAGHRSPSAPRRA